MVAIEVDEKDTDKVFEILLSNGSFSGLAKNIFRLDEHSQEALRKLKQANIDVKILN